MSTVWGQSTSSSLLRIMEHPDLAGLDIVAGRARDGTSGFSTSFGEDAPAGSAERVSAGVGRTVALENGRHLLAVREITAAVPFDASQEVLTGVYQRLLDVAESEVVRQLDSLRNWDGIDGPVRHFTDANFYQVLLADLQNASSSILILAPFLGRRLDQIVQPLVDARARGVRVTALIRPSLTHVSWARWSLDALRAAGVEISSRTEEAHEKLVVVDRSIVYHGSLNPLSHKDTSESILRFESRAMADCFFLMYDPASGQGFIETVDISRLPGQGRVVRGKTLGNPPPGWHSYFPD